jgi:segregation and condensation protein B
MLRRIRSANGLRFMTLPLEPGQQLRSVALRYASPLRRSAPEGPSRRVRAFAPLGAPFHFDVGHLRADDSPPRDPSEQEGGLARLEAVLVLARESLSSRKLAQYAGLADGTQARTLIRRLNERYDAAGRAFRIEQVAGGYQLRTRRIFAPWLRRLAHVPGESRLSAPALETLAVVAYRQPVPRADIEAIRGVNCGEILRQLMERELVRVCGRGEELGRPFLYATTSRFLELFGLMQLGDLPRAEMLRHAPLPAAVAPVTILTEPPGEPDRNAPPVDEPWSEADTSDENLINIDE